jgi:hypothetical protein
MTRYMDAGWDLVENIVLSRRSRTLFGDVSLHDKRGKNARAVAGNTSLCRRCFRLRETASSGITAIRFFLGLLSGSKRSPPQRNVSSSR